MIDGPVGLPWDRMKGESRKALGLGQSRGIAATMSASGRVSGQRSWLRRNECRLLARWTPRDRRGLVRQAVALQESFAAINPDLAAATCLWRPPEHPPGVLAREELKFLRNYATQVGLGYRGGSASQSEVLESDKLVVLPVVHRAVDDRRD